MNYQINQEAEASNTETIVDLFDVYGYKTQQELTNFLMEMQTNLVILRKNHYGETYTDECIKGFMSQIRMLVNLVTGLTDPRVNQVA